MPVSREALVETLSQCPPEQLAEVLSAAGLSTRDRSDPGAMAQRLARMLWWRTHTPIGNWVAPDTLDDMLNRIERRTKLELGPGDAWARLDALARAALSEEELDLFCRGNKTPVLEDPVLQKKLRAGLPWGSFAGTAGAGGAAGARWASFGFLRLTAGPIGRILPLLPKVGPTYLVLRKGAQVVAKASGPVGIAMGAAAINGALGAEYDRALPILLGVAVLKRGLDHPSP
ncbi:MAG: hypothetical protein H6739_31715 [Alphaproteobacteria bacterium]|nr:hypothetical protein [Alphaproteobacteria bacterium]